MYFKKKYRLKRWLFERAKEGEYFSTRTAKKSEKDN